MERGEEITGGKAQCMHVKERAGSGMEIIKSVLWKETQKIGLKFEWPWIYSLITMRNRFYQ